MIGQIFDRLMVAAPPIPEGKRRRVVCLCACGVVVEVEENHLVCGHTRSCGCLQRELAAKRLATHGRYYEPEYRAWANMHKRCSDPRFAKWYEGISVCAGWKSYQIFLADVGRKPSATHSLDRIDPKGNYAPDNVRWASKATQSRNTKNHETNKTGVRGVSWSNAKGKWRAAIYANNMQKHLGYYETIFAAKAARELGEQTYWKELK